MSGELEFEEMKLMKLMKPMPFVDVFVAQSGPRNFLCGYLWLILEIS